MKINIQYSISLLPIIGIRLDKHKMINDERKRMGKYGGNSIDLDIEIF